eukprot:TRINITY_DN54_c1_g1_i3.p2 TRINITY_DN54_c1_g1~~TRINITY_DN54_c1_g1_i3.p2  ORF type:complete len:134 (+),score=37.51 TRINITY_DN54_c1_g1_i3:56-457(+)
MAAAAGEVVGDKELIACCGLYCGSCSSLQSGKCVGCARSKTAPEERAADWCPVRKCCRERGITNCAACPDFADPNACAKFHSMISRVIGYCLGSDRAACVLRIREVGPDAFAAEMAASKRQTIHKGSWNPLDW